MNNAFRAVVFDVDGTLLDTSEMWRELGARYLDEKGIAHSADLPQRLSALSLDEGAQLLAEQYTKTNAAAVKAELCEKMARFYRFEAQPKRGAAALISALSAKKIPLALATAGNAQLAQAALERLGLFGDFCGIADCAQYGAKTSANVFLAAAEFCGAAAPQCVVFEDSLYAITTAKNAGFVTAAVCDCSEPKQDELKRTAHFYRDSLLEYAELLTGENGL